MFWKLLMLFFFFFASQLCSTSCWSIKSNWNNKHECLFVWKIQTTNNKYIFIVVVESLALNTFPKKFTKYCTPSHTASDHFSGQKWINMKLMLRTALLVCDLITPPPPRVLLIFLLILFSHLLVAMTKKQNWQEWRWQTTLSSRSNPVI